MKWEFDGPFDPVRAEDFMNLLRKLDKSGFSICFGLDHNHGTSINGENVLMGHQTTGRRT
ncbi:MAG: hypothetical protein UT24_C0011G0016 [Candidatus Woesebacteria bacterium GW2011_GWB1_39_12]|uniref:Uncharacterized protein n=1 Tax=Candidatus Woesebacteria bacterium GW2011_GWB1_39_12 TaxID=1618574 RepID=A0A0G0MBH0_9BACT|nr:MAG: hypothetical protein UT24_C0011G0016 [Candidatus Woesebacteria bacterium GW2011_GWB1_39_12]